MADAACARPLEAAAQSDGGSKSHGAGSGKLHLLLRLGTDEASDEEFEGHIVEPLWLLLWGWEHALLARLEQNCPWVGELVKAGFTVILAHARGSDTTEGSLLIQQLLGASVHGCAARVALAQSSLLERLVRGEDVQA